MVGFLHVSSSSYPEITLRSIILNRFSFIAYQLPIAFSIKIENPCTAKSGNQGSPCGILTNPSRIISTTSIKSHLLQTP